MMRTRNSTITRKFMGTLVASLTLSLAVQADDPFRISVDAGGSERDMDSFHAAISRDGSSVAFFSCSYLTGPVSPTGRNYLYVYDWNSGALESIPASSPAYAIKTSNDIGTTDYATLELSASGRFIVFEEYAIDDGPYHLAVYDRQSASHDVLSFDGLGYTPGSKATISSDGQFVVFEDSEDVSGPFLHQYDCAAGELRQFPPQFDERTRGKTPRISANGEWVVFRSWDDHLVPGDTNNRSDIYLYHRASGEIRRVSIAGDLQFDANCYQPTISDDGSRVAFYTEADNVTGTDENLFVYEVNTGELLHLADITTLDRTALPSRRYFKRDGGSHLPAISGDGRTVEARCNDYANVRIDVDSGTIQWVDPSWRTYGPVSADLNRRAYFTDDAWQTDDTNNRSDVYIQSVSLISTGGTSDTFEANSMADDVGAGPDDIATLDDLEVVPMVPVCGAGASFAFAPVLLTLGLVRAGTIRRRCV